MNNHCCGAIPCNLQDGTRQQVPCPTYRFHVYRTIQVPYRFQVPCQHKTWDLPGSMSSAVWKGAKDHQPQLCILQRTLQAWPRSNDERSSMAVSYNCVHSDHISDNPEQALWPHFSFFSSQPVKGSLKQFVIP